MSLETRTRQRDPEATREKLLDAALHCFSTSGFDGSSTRQIEAQAGVKRGLITHHFGSKKALWEAMVERTMATAREEFAVANQVEDADAESRLRHLVHALVRYSARHPEVNRLMIQEGMRDDWRLQWLMKNSVQPMFKWVTGILEEARAGGLVLPIENHNLFYILIGSATVFFANAEEVRLLTGRNTLSESEINAHANSLIELLFPKAKS